MTPSEAASTVLSIQKNPGRLTKSGIDFVNSLAMGARKYKRLTPAQVARIPGLIEQAYGPRARAMFEAPPKYAEVNNLISGLSDLIQKLIATPEDHYEHFECFTGAKGNPISSIRFTSFKGNSEDALAGIVYHRDDRQSFGEYARCLWLPVARVKILDDRETVLLDPIECNYGISYYGIRQVRLFLSHLSKHPRALKATSRGTRKMVTRAA